jgi:hypothetical protein
MPENFHFQGQFTLLEASTPIPLTDALLLASWHQKVTAKALAKHAVELVITALQN